MKINTRFLFIGLLLSIPVFAQNTGLTLNIRNTFSDARNFKMGMTVDLTFPLQSGFFIQLPSGVKATPVTVFLAEKELWLKETKSVPQKQNIIHWSRQDNGILFLFADGMLTSSRLLLQLQAFMPGKAADTARLELREIQHKTGEGFSPSVVIGGAQLFQIKNNEIR